MFDKLGLALAVSAAALAAPQAWAQTAANPATEGAPAAPTTGQRYALADLAAFAPRTALDMVSQIPGFAITAQGGGGNRGLGAATENVLINGQRIADKSTDAATALSRITASAVRHIDIVDGASLNVPGLTGQVANVVLADSASRKFTTTIRWQPELRPGIADSWYEGEISTSGLIGRNTVTLSFNSNMARRGHWGPEQVQGADGSLRFVRDEYARYYSDAPRLAFALARTATNGNLLNVNVAGQYDSGNTRISGVSVQPGIGRVDEFFQQREKEWNGSVGGDYELNLGRGRLKLIGQYRFEHDPTVNRFTVTRAGRAPTGSRFTQTADESESILRGEYGWRSAGGTDWQVALEGAYNLLDVGSELARLQGDGIYRPDPAGLSATKVDEKRADASLTWGRALAGNLTAQLNVGVEYSQLRSTGPGGKTRSFIRPKGRLALAWKADAKTTFNYVLQRRVDQLDFFDFASSVDIADNNSNAGNADLVPPIINRTELEVVRDLSAWGNVSVAIAYAIAEDLVDQVPLSATTEGRGNLTPAKLYRLSSRATLLLDPIGLTGVRLNSDITLRRNRVRDPLTNAWRNQSSGQEYEIDLGLRHDIPASNWAWGASYFADRYSPDVRLSEVSDSFKVRPFVAAFVEHKNVGGFTVRAELRNIAKMQDALDRTVYAGRRTGPVDFLETRRRDFGRIFRLTVTGTL